MSMESTVQDNSEKVPDGVAMRHPPGALALRPALAQATATVLALCDGERSIADIRATVMARYPALLPSPEAIRQFVDDVLARHTD